MSVGGSRAGLRRTSNAAILVPILIVALLSLAGLALALPREARASPASFHPSAGSTLVVITATTAFTFVSASPSVTTLQIAFEIENAGSDDHTFTLSSRVNQTAPSGTDASTSAAGTWFDTAHVLADISIAAGHTGFVNVTVPSVGSYQFVCRYHFTSGMVGTLVVGAPASSDSSSTPLYLYGGIAVAVIVALVVVVVLLRRSRTRTPPVAEAPK